MPASASLIVVNYRSASLAVDAIRTARAASQTDLQVIVVDNSVDIGEAEALRAHAEILITPDQNLGYGAAINRARAKCDGEVLIVANADGFFRRAICILPRMHSTRRSPPAPLDGGAVAIGIESRNAWSSGR